jgi:hydrogenase nickel incorporation protein HypA/HybF
MHELSLVRSLLTQAAELMIGNGGAAVERIRVEIGPLSGAEPELVQLAFEQLAVESPCRGAQLLIEVVPLTCQCAECAADFVMHDFRFRCPECDATSVRVVTGDEFRIIDVTIRIADEQELCPAFKS